MAERSAWWRSKYSLAEVKLRRMNGGMMLRDQTLGSCPRCWDGRPEGLIPHRQGAHEAHRERTGRTHGLIRPMVTGIGKTWLNRVPASRGAQSALGCTTLLADDLLLRAHIPAQAGAQGAQRAHQSALGAHRGAQWAHQSALGAHRGAQWAHWTAHGPHSPHGFCTAKRVTCEWRWVT